MFLNIFIYESSSNNSDNSSYIKHKPGPKSYILLPNRILSEHIDQFSEARRLNIS